MKKDKNEINFSSVLLETKRDKNGMSMQLFSFVILTLLCLMLAYVFPASLVVSLPFVIIPAYFGFTATNIAKKSKGGEDVSFFRMFRVYFTQFFFGGYRLLFGALKSFAAYAGSQLVILTIFESTLFKSVPGYNAILEKVTTTTDISAVLEEFMEFMSSNELMLKYMSIATSITLLLAVFFFIQHIGKQSIKMRRNLFRQPPLPMAQINYVYKFVRKENRSYFFRTYSKTVWFYQLLIVLAGVGGVLLNFFVLKDYDGVQGVVISLALMLIVSIPFLNYIAKMQDLIYISLSNKFEETNVRVTLELLNRYKDRINISEEDAKKIQEVLEEAKKASEKVIEEDKEEKDSE
jgi:hypothetical protein